DARRIAFYFAPELVRRLEPDPPRAQDRLFHQPNHSFFLKISLGCPVLPNRCTKICELRLGKRPALCDGRQGESKEDPIDEAAHALILYGRVKFSKCIARAARAHSAHHTEQKWLNPVPTGTSEISCTPTSLQAKRAVLVHLAMKNFDTAYPLVPCHIS